jgi:hypothetical protein
MGLIINKTGLTKVDGSELPSTGIFVKFIMQSEWDGFNQKFFLRYYISHQKKIDDFQPITIIELPNDFVKELDLERVIFYEQLVGQIMPNASCFEKTFFTYHLFVKEKLEDILGENTVEIRPDLG